MVAADRSARGVESAENIQREKRVPGRRVALAVATAALIALAMWGFSALRDGGPLAPSSEGEQVLRTMRLAGFDRVWVSEGDGAVSVFLVMPGIDSPADVEIAWQTAFASLASAFRATGEFRVGIVSDDEIVAELSGAARDIVRVVESGDATGLRDAVAVEYILADLSDAGPTPAEVLAQATTPEDAAYLDAKNRAAGLLGDEGPVQPEAEQLADECDSMRAVVAGRPAVRPEEALKEYSSRIVANLVRSDAGADRVIDEIARLAGATPAGGTDGVARLRTISLVVEAFAAEEPYGDLLANTAAIAGLVADNKLAEGAASDAVLAAARDSAASETAVRIDSFARSEDLDLRPGSEGASVVGAVVRAISSGVPVQLSDTVVTVPSQVWEAYRRADGTVYWRGEAGTEFALTDGSLRGWAFSRGAAAAVDPDNVGIVHSLILSDSVPR